MNSFFKNPCATTFFSGVFCLVFPVTSALSQPSELETLKVQLQQMQEQMQKMALRIEDLERAQAQPAGPSPDTPKAESQPGVTKGVSSAFNPAISVNGLFLGGYSSSPRRTTELTGLDFHNGFNFQEAEFQFTADVDPYWKANFILAIGRDGEVELEEGYATSEQLPYDLLPRNLSLKVGKFFPFFGKHNLLHAHQFPFISRPLIHQSIFGSEGLKEPGLALAYLLPAPWFSELTFQGLTGENESLFRFEEDAKRRGAYLGHLKNFFDLSDTTTLEIGNSYVGGRNSFRELSQAVGLDLTLKWRPLQNATERALIWQSEYLYFARDRAEEGFTRGGGLYSSLQYQFARRWWVQGRYDLSGVPRFDDGRRHRWTTLLAFVPSEFSAIRLQHSYTSQETGTSLNEVLLQLNYTIGSHPAHQY